MQPDRIDLSPDEMRELGYRAVDMIVEHLAALSRRPVGKTAARDAMDERLVEPLPAQGTAPLEVLEAVRRDILDNTLHVNHPRFFAFIPSPGNFVGAIADALASGFNVFAGTWLAGSAAIETELVVVDWLRQMCGMPEAAGGLLVSGGSVANLTALAVAREQRLDDLARAIVYYSDQTHSSIDRALRVLGFQAAHLRRIPADSSQRLPPGLLRQAIDADREAGRNPFCVVANVGTTNTGAVDPLPEIAAICREYGLWLHADGAYGAAAALSPRAQTLLEGMGEVDSLSLDPHKWLFQPFEIGCVLVREAHWLRQTFAIHPEYMKDTARELEEPNLCEYGIQLTRMARGLKLWMSLKIFGADAFRAAITRGIELAEFAEAELRRQPHCEVTTPAQLAIVSFRYTRPGAGEDENDALNERLVRAMMKESYAVLTSTRLHGRTVLRLCTINPRTTEPDITETIRRLTSRATNAHS